MIEHLAQLPDKQPTLRVMPRPADLNANGDVFLNGFWKAEDTCSLYNPTITSLTRGTNNVAITFLVVNGNTYSVSYITQDQGGLPAGTGAITNPVQTIDGAGVAGGRISPARRPPAAGR